MQKASAENREFSAEETEQYDRHVAEFREAQASIDRLQNHQALQSEIDSRVFAGEGEFTYDSDRRGVKVLSREERMADIAPKSTPGGVAVDELSIGRIVRGVAIGDWTGAEAERRTMSEGTLTAGGYLVPEPLSARIIDRARNKAALFRAGATTVPMDSSTLKIARVSGDASAAWKAENATASFSDLAFEVVTFEAKTLVAIAKMSVELFEDAPNVDDVVENSMADVLAIELDRAGLVGSGVDPEPQGIFGATNVNVVDLGANGAALTNYDPFIDAIEDVENANGMATAAIFAPRTSAALSKLKTGITSDNTPLQAPEAYRNLQRFVTNQVPIDLTKGTSNDASLAFVGDFSQVLVGVRRNIVLEATKVGADGTSGAFTDLQVWVRAYLRADVQLAIPSHLAVIDGIIPYRIHRG
jgi:HK97 family phage major capsid protein